MFWKDDEQPNFKGGFIIFLTNDNWYYKSDEKGIKNITKLGKKNIKKSCADLLTSNKSTILWQDYSEIIEEKNNTAFKFLMLEFPLK